MKRSLKIAVAEPSLIIRSGLLSVLRRFGSLNIQVVEIDDIAQLGSSLCRLKPDVLIVNPGFLGLFSLRQIKSESGCHRLKCVALQYAISDALSLKEYDETVSVFDTADDIRDKLTRLTDENLEKPLQETLSAREREIVVCVVKGMTNKQIAEQLYLSTHTVMTHRRNIAAKLQIHSPAGLTIYAIVNKLVELNDVKATISESEKF